MKYWNYRVIHNGDLETPSYQIHSVYYDKDENITAWSKSPPVIPPAADIESLRESLNLISDAFKQPVLYLEESAGVKKLVPLKPESAAE